MDIVMPSDVDRSDTDQEDVHVTLARVVIGTTLSKSSDRKYANDLGNVHVNWAKVGFIYLSVLGMGREL